MDSAKDESNHDIFINDDAAPKSCLDCLPRITCSLFTEDSPPHQQHGGGESGGWENFPTKFFFSQLVKHGFASQQEVDVLPGNLEKSLNDSCRMNTARQLVSFWFDVPFVQVKGILIDFLLIDIPIQRLLAPLTDTSILVEAAH